MTASVRTIGLLVALLVDEGAEESYATAAAAAIELDDRLRAAQLEVRLGVASGLGGSLTAAVGHFEQAVSHWKAAGTIDPAAILVHEIGWLLRRRARHQLGIAIDWGRYGELFEYDAERGQLALGSDATTVGG